MNGLGSADFQQGRFEEALRWYEKAIELREATGDVEGLATSLNYASNCQTQLGRPIEARQLLERALPILQETGADRRRIEVMHSVGVMYRNTQRHGRAIEAFEEALSLIAAAPEYEATIRLDLAAALLEQGRIRASIEETSRAEELAGENTEPMFQFHLRTQQGRSLLALGDLDRACAELEVARDLAEGLGVPELVAQAESNLANALNEAGRADEALAVAREALSTARATGATRFEVDAAKVVADALVLLGRDEDALALADTVVSQHQATAPELLTELRTTRGFALSEVGRFGDARRELRDIRAAILSRGLGDMEWVPLIGIGDSFEALAPDSSRVYYEEALASLEAYRAVAASGALRTSFLADQRGVIYEDVTHFYAQQSFRRDPERWSALAFRTAERARARGLLELVTRSFAADEDPEIASLLDRLYELDETGSAEAEDRQRIQDEIARRFDARLETTAPWTSDASAIAGPMELGATLDDDTVALVYAVGEDASYVWAVDRRGHVLEQIDGRDVLREHVVALREALLTPGFGDRALATEARALYEKLIGPVASRVRGKDRIWIVPDGVLFEIPFEVLLSDDPGERPDWQRAEYLARDHRIGYAPSANLLVALREEAATQSDAVLALGDPDFSGLSPRAGMTEELPPLPQSRAEVETLVRLRDDTVTLLGADATEGHLRSALQETHPSIVHLATHGLVDREEPSLTSVALAADADAAEDGYLYTLEILALPLDAQLVVLSACDTGRGKLERGEGTVGLTRSFLAAGAKRVVSSLWPVADASTSELMQSFYEELLDRGRDPDDALARARKELWKTRETAHPYYWAPFVLMGSDAPLPADVRG